MTGRGGDAAAMVKIDIAVQSALWRQTPSARQTVRRAIAAAAAGNETDLQGDVSVMLTDDEAIRTLNRQWRGQDRPTNVLSFPAPLPVCYAGGARVSLGDIAIAYETVAREAEAEGKPFEHHLAHLAVHGFLHLVGFDHESDHDAEAMEQRERDILARLDVPDPYARAG